MNNFSDDKKKRFVAPLSDMEDLILKSIENGGEFRLITAGFSMMPLLRNRKDIVVLRKPEGRLKKYDIPLYKRKNGQYVLHRVVKCTQGCYYLRGDNQLETEKGIKDENIIAVVSKIIRGSSEINVKTSILYKFYVFFRCRLFPIRYVFRKIRSAVALIVKKLLSKLNI